MNGQQRTTGRIIIADDVPHVRASMRTMLTLALGVTVVGEAGTAAELLGLLAMTEADIIIMDRDLIGLDDEATVEEMRRLAPESRIVLCSVFDRADGMRDCPIKPDFMLSKSRGPEYWLEALNTMLMRQPPGVINLAVEKSPEMRKMMFQDGECPMDESPPLDPNEQKPTNPLTPR